MLQGVVPSPQTFGLHTQYLVEREVVRLKEWEQVQLAEPNKL